MFFEPFYSTKATGEGTGLGMAMAYGIIRNHNGAITCESVIGSGSIFKIYLPAVNVKVKRESKKEKEKIQKGKGETILIIEDETVLRKLISQVLTLNGYHVITAETGEKGLEIYAAEKEKISLIILDMIMPGMGGKLCMKEIVKVDPDAKVVIASGHTSVEAKKEISLMGAQGFIEKPYDFQDILKMISSVI